MGVINPYYTKEAKESMKNRPQSQKTQGANPKNTSVEIKKPKPTENKEFVKKLASSALKRAVIKLIPGAGTAIMALSPASLGNSEIPQEEQDKMTAMIKKKKAK